MQGYRLLHMMHPTQRVIKIAWFKAWCVDAGYMCAQVGLRIILLGGLGGRRAAPFTTASKHTAFKQLGVSKGGIR